MLQCQVVHCCATESAALLSGACHCCATQSAALLSGALLVSSLYFVTAHVISYQICLADLSGCACCCALPLDSAIYPAAHNKVHTDLE